MESPPSGENQRPRWLYGGDKFTGIGPAKVSDAEMEGVYGKLVDQQHQKMGLGLRDGPCDRWKSCDMDQDKMDVAVIAMKARLTMRLDICVKQECSSSDMVMVALLAADERVTPKTLKAAFQNPSYKSANESVTLDWESFLDGSNWKKGKDRRKNKQLINRFSENVKDLQTDNFPEIDWGYIKDLGRWKFRDFIDK